MLPKPINPAISEQDIQKKCDDEMARLYVSQAHTTSIAGLVCLVPFALVTMPFPGRREIGIWFLGMTLLFFFRWLWTMILCGKGKLWKLDVFRRYLLSFSVGLAGFGWGFATWWFGWPGEVAQIPLLIVAIGILTISPPILSANPVAGILFVIPFVTGIIMRLRAESSDVFVPAAVMTVLAGFFAVALSFKYYFDLKKRVMLGIEKEALFDRILADKLRAEESSYAKGSFIAMMSHEIRTPISGLMGMLEILKETELTSTQSNYLNTASRSAESLLQLLNDILDYSKIEVGKLELEKVPFDWIAMTGEIAMMDRVLADEKGIAFHLEIPLESPSIVVGDPTRLRQILNNLLSNALKFTSEGHIWFRATIESEKPDRVIISFSVRDTGIGIEPEAQQKLFQQYQQAHVSTSRRYGGSGLGLAISQRLAHLMGGNIRFSSEPGKGSEFILTVPFARATPAAFNDFIASNQNVIADHYSAKVLVVEDDPVSQRVSALMLKSFGITPTVVSDGTAAVEAAKREKFDIIFMDSRLPDMDGYEASKIINGIGEQADPSAAEKKSGAVIVAMTASDTPEDRLKARESGIVEFLPKPVRKRDMRQCLDRWIGRQPRKTVILPTSVAAPSTKETPGKEAGNPAKK